MRGGRARPGPRARAVARDLHKRLSPKHLHFHAEDAAMGLIRAMVPGRRDLRNAAVLGATNWALRRWGGSKGERAARVLANATWAVPLGLMVVNRVRSRRG